jgi:transposase
MDGPRLFPDVCEVAPTRASAGPQRQAAVRVVRATRNQAEWAPRDLESALAEDHAARAIWNFLERLELSAFYARVRSVAGGAGRPATDPQVLLGLWLLATVEGVGSARQLARLCEQHDAYRWMRGGVPVNYHMLADFRVEHRAALDGLLTEIVGSLMAAGAVTLQRVAQDGMRVRASAGASSFRREERLLVCLTEAQAQVERLARERERPDPGVNKRARAARVRAAREREARLEQALAYLPEAQAAKDLQRKRAARAERGQVTAARASSTDPQARVMKMADGGFRPAYNVQLATDALSGVVVGVAVTPSGSDAEQASTMVEQVQQRAGRAPRDYLMDGGFAAREQITALEQRGIDVYAPVRLPKRRPEGERYEPRYGDTAEVIRWRQRMATDEAKAVYRQRAASAEWTNAQFRWRHGLHQFTVRGVDKTLSVVLLIAIAHNLLRWLPLST